ncbi:heme biosynthesis protein HemY [Sneathiella aquimaris]|uniref:heme biosynthesis protein HemY n=1 Tax=Sneathiella aquimaris TaxID=2599305 RepID=UPI00146C9BE4|nr:heme biosynthesis HemY N-terminal domain-containing protein [Sneathiella aquimaris]
MIRSLYLFILLSLLALAGVWVADNPGQVALRWDNYVIETSVVVLVIATLIVALVLMVLYQLFFWLKSGPGRLGGIFSARRRSKGMDALSHGMVAIAAGDSDGARKAAVAAEKHLQGEPLTLLLAAQAAELNQDDRAARIYYSKMTENPETEFLGLRGLIQRAKAENDLDLALLYVEKADKLKPGTEWVLKDLLGLFLKLHRYEDADKTLTRMARGKTAKSDRVKHMRAVIAYQRALPLAENGEKEKALTLALDAHDLDPAFVPASVMAISLSQPGRKLDKLINDAWRHAPHPDIAKAVKNLIPVESPADWLLRAKRLIAPLKPEHPETMMVMARAALDAQEWGQARGYLNKTADIDPRGSVYRLMAELEERANADAIAARKWILESVEAPQDPLWVCESCGRQEKSWTADCPSCGTFDSLIWRKPDQGVTSGDLLEAEIVQEIEAPKPT